MPKHKPMVKAKVQVKERGDVFQKHLLGALERTGSHYVINGIITPNLPYPDEDVTLGQVAAWMEFGTHSANGTPIVPARSFIRASADLGRRGIAALKQRLLQQIFDGKISVEHAYKELGQDMVRRQQNTILGRIPPPLKPATLARRTPDQGTIPLLRTTFLFKHLGFKVLKNSLFRRLRGKF